MNINWKSRRIVIAVGIAVMADMFQFALGAAQLSGVLFVPAEILDVMMDFAVAVALCFLIGFHWLLLPTMFAEFFPAISLFPTFTGCTLFVIGQKRNAAVQKNLVMEVAELKAVSPCPPVLPPVIRQISLTEEMAVSHLQIPLKSANGVEQTCEAKLREVQDLFEKRLISQAELDAKRQQILAEI